MQNSQLARDNRVCIACLREVMQNLESVGNVTDGVGVEEMCDRVREKVKRLIKKYRELKMNNEEF